MVKTVASVGDDDSCIIVVSAGDMADKDRGQLHCLMIKKKNYKESKVNKIYQVILKDTI